MPISKFLREKLLSLVSSVVVRNKGTATDPVQKLFVDKIREYAQRSTGGKLVDPSPSILKEMQKELEKMEKQFGGGPGVDMTTFPTFQFDQVKIDPIDEATPDKRIAKKKKGGKGKK
ncbi:ATP synthase-coupling factor 6, mitochondrial-like [Spodoptera frugiperda]|uniref:ATP synthase-coupling factor 6, mitochondrial-like n=1 Tax=Spodoptera frugiperda TaxID=7108 RepID=A0A9R0DHV1_SPOFR|nr:ATP synthase-coupling factor 6, mitochondrial-like [Spodoptera frugiperda]